MADYMKIYEKWVSSPVVDADTKAELAAIKNDDKEIQERFLVDNEDEKVAKVALVMAAKSAIGNGLALLGMKAPEKM